MTLLNEKIVGEEITVHYKVFVVALPPSNGAYIKVCPIPFNIFEGRFYYENGKSTTHDVVTEEAEAIKRAMKFLPDTDDYKITTTYAHGDEAHRAKLLKKLQGMTRWEFYNSKY